VNVCLLSDAIQPPLTGIGRYVFELAAGLHAHGGVDNVELMSYRGREQWCDLRAHCVSSDDHGDKNKALAWQTLLSRCRGWLIDRKVVSATYEAVQNLQYRRALAHRTGCVIHGPNYHLPDQYPMSNASVVTVHDLSTELFPQWHPDQRVQRMRRALRSAVARAQLVLVDASSTAVDLMERFHVPSEKVVAIPLGIDPAFSKSPISLPRRYTLCVSTIEPRKNINTLLSAYRTLPAALRREYPLMLVGGYGWKSEQTHHQIDAGVSEGWLHYLGYVAQSELLQLYAGAVLVAYPSLHEGFGLPVLEAMASGCRVVAGNHSSIPEVAGSLANLVNVSDTSELAHAIQNALEEKWSIAAAMARRAHTAKFTWQSTVAKTVAAYQIALNHMKT
jgi:glycosyltransferase involved in cell wall biosynthesis